MNTITLQNIIEYTNSINLNIKKVNIQNEIEKIKGSNQNNNYVFIDLFNINIFENNHYNSLILLYPIFECNTIQSFIHSFFTTTNEKYINFTLTEKLNLITQYTSNFNYNTFNKYYNYILIKNDTFIIKNHNAIKYLVFIMIDDYYYAIINNLHKFFIISSPLISFIFNNLKKENDEEQDECYELEINNNDVLNLTEVEDIIINKNKNSKKIFVLPKNIENSLEYINNEDLHKLIKNVKIIMKLEELQSIATKLDIPIINGTTSKGMPKNKKKEELFNDIKNKII